MKRKLITGGLMLVLFFMSMTAGAAANVTRGTYYTRSNIWYEHPSKIYSTHYHMGKILPVGSKVQVIDVNAARIRFRDEATQQEFYMTHLAKHSVIRWQHVLARYFSTENIREKRDFTAEELKNIVAGTVAVGMRKKAVLAAYGYPPSHRTPDLYGDEWIYWVTKSQTKTVIFDDETVVSIR